MATKNCIVCGKEMHVKPSRVERTRYCSKECAKKGWTGQRRSPGTEFKKGNVPPSYRGGRYSDGHGYEYVRIPGHPMANQNGYVPEHRLNWAKAHGMESVPAGMVVHHLNGIRSDNRVENLVAMPKAEHSPVLNIKDLQDRLRKVEAELAELKSQPQTS